MSLLCALGFHTATRAPRWNDGYYFARCARCRVDLVRTPFSRWHVPTGYRVVWQAEPPVSRPDVKLEPELALEPAEPIAPPVPEAAAPPAEPAATPVETVEQRAVSASAEEPGKAEPKRRRLPVEALLERLRGTPGPSASLPDPPAPQTTRSHSDWDFMMEPGERAWSAAPAPPLPSQQPVAAAEPSSTAVAVHPNDARRGPSIVRRAAARLRRRAGSTLRWARHSKGLAQAGVAAVILAVLVVAILALPKQPPVNRQVPAAAAATPADVQAEQPQATAAPQNPAYVSARALSCRDAPALQARRVRVLARGAAVQVLARDGDWVSLATAVGQCWALGRYVSEPRPL